MSNEQILSALRQHGLDADKYMSVLVDHERRAVEFLEASEGSDEGAAARIAELALVLRQTFLHRSIMLIRSAGLSLSQQNGYALALAVRAHFETTAALGYLHYRLGSLRAGNLSPAAVDKDLKILLLGSRDKGILSIDGADDFEAKQVLTMLEYADKSVSRSVMGASANKHKMLMGIYKWLSEFCHLNFHSNQLAFTLSRERGGFVFRHEGNLDCVEANILGNLLISGPVFVHLYDEIQALIETTGTPTISKDRDTHNSQ